MLQTSGLTTQRPRLPLPVKWWAFFAVCALAMTGCAARPVVISECPIPNIEEQNDLELFLNWEPDRPAALYMARVLGDVYGLELEEERNGADPE